MVEYFPGIDPETLMSAGALAAMGAFLVVYAIIALAIYIYMAFALMAIANKTKTQNGWLAFIPIANFYLVTQMAKKSPWWTLAVLLPMIPFVGGLALAVIGVWFLWIVCERIKRPGWWSLLLLIPIVNLVIIGIMAWNK
ncbi:hypothetical protein J4465_02130 [Candidatus Pacearchaeota archaeon]|nr:hypothetical protein [Candidatus Pacearchaeota archaeon]